MVGDTGAELTGQHLSMSDGYPVHEVDPRRADAGDLEALETSISGRSSERIPFQHRTIDRVRQ